MSFDRLYRASLYLSLFLASLLLSIDASGDNRFALAYPLAVAVASALAYVTVDRDPKKGLPRDFANFLALFAFGLGLLEYLNDPNLMLLAIGHTLIYLQLVIYALPKNTEDDWYLFLLGLVQVVIGAHVSQSDEVGILLFLWVLATIWAFGLFYLHRETLQDGAPCEAATTGSPSQSKINSQKLLGIARPAIAVTPLAARDDPYPGLLDRGFVLATIRVAGTTLVLGTLIFFLMPRWSTKSGNRGGKVTAAKHLTGFTDSVRLGDMGEILNDDSVVLSMELTDERDQVLTAPPDLLLRGITLTGYGGGTWTRTTTVTSPAEPGKWNRTSADSGPEIRQRIKMEATDSDILFSLRPIRQVKGSIASEIGMNDADGTIFRGDRRENRNDPDPPRAAKFDYQVVSSANALDAQRDERYPNPDRMRDLLDFPEPLQKSLKAIIEPILAQLPADQRVSNNAKARALERYLRDGDFTYSLNMTRKDKEIDPVIDFLVNRKEGHCEYFASALALMCRAAGVPARLVNGFKGGDWNQIGRVTHVREKHAHSWVEALVGTLPGNPPRPMWLTLDPTPSRQREEVVAKVGAGAFKFRFLSDSIRWLWTFNVVGYDNDRQERFLYGPAREAASEAARGFRIFFAMIRDLPSWLYFEDFRHFFSVRGFFVSVLAMLSLVGFFSLGRWVWMRLFARRREGAGTDDGRDPSVAFYHRLVKILASLGLERPQAETPREFAKRATDLVHVKWPGSEHSAVPGLVVEAFYSRRFGRNELSPETVRDLENRLEDLEAGVSSSIKGS